MTCIFNFACNLSRFDSEENIPQSGKVRKIHFFNWLPKVSWIWKGPKQRKSHDIATQNDNNFRDQKEVNLIQKLAQMDNDEISEIRKILCTETERNNLCEKMLDNIKDLVKVDYGSVYFSQDGFYCRSLVKMHRRYSVIQPNLDKTSIQRNGIIEFVEEYGEVINISDVTKDSRFHNDPDLTGSSTKAVLCMPIKEDNETIIGVILLGRNTEKRFSKSDEDLISSYLKVFIAGIKNTHSLEKMMIHLNKNQILLELTSAIFDERKDLDEIIYSILKYALKSSLCQRVQVLLFSSTENKFSAEYFLNLDDLDSLNSSFPRRTNSILNQNIGSFVLKSGEILNIEDVSKDHRFILDNDSEDFVHEKILSLPIKNPAEEVIGVLLFSNKVDGTNFSKSDETFLEGFALFCGMGIHNQQMLEKIKLAKAKLEVTIEVLSFHSIAPLEEANKLKNLNVSTGEKLGLYSFKFDDEIFSNSETLEVVLAMFIELNFIKTHHIDYLVFCRWVLTVKKNYRDVIYHNWRHALNVTQLMLAMIMTSEWNKVYGEEVTFGMLIACICHDIDHRGENNDFQIKASTPLSKLYSSSMMERHHLDLCLMILNSKETQILSHVSSDKYKTIIQTIEHLILSTDLMLYLRDKGKFENILKEQKWDWSEANHKKLLQSMLMTASDLGALARPWEVSIKTVAKVIGEFFHQGDIEKCELHITPNEMMDRTKGKDLPQMQIGFIEMFCVPLFKNLAELSPALMPLYEQLLLNKEMWELESQYEDKTNSPFFSILKEYNIYSTEDDSLEPSTIGQSLDQ